MGEAIEYLACQLAVGVDGILAAAGFAERVVVGDEYEGAVGVGGADGVDELEVVLPEGGGVEVGGHGVVDADAEDDEVGVEHAQVAHEMGAAQVVGHGGTVDADGAVGDARVAVAEVEPREGELLA